MTQTAPPEPAKEAPKPIEAPKGLRRFFTLKWMLGAIGILIVGGLGSGVWEMVIKPIFYGIAYVLAFFGGSFGQYYVDVLYKNPSLGIVEQERDFWRYIVAFSVFMSGLFFVVFFHYFACLQLPPKVSPPKLFRRIWWLLLITAFYYLAAAHSDIRLGFRNDMLANFQTTLAIASPYMTEKEQLAAKARFAAVSNKKDYVDLMNSLKKISEENGQKLPAFDVW